MVNTRCLMKRIPLFLSIAVLVVPLSVIAQNVTQQEKASKPIPPLTLAVTEVATGIQAPTALVFPNKNEIWVSEQSGKIRIISAGKLLAEPLIDLKNKLIKLNRGYEERGLLGDGLTSSI